MDAIRVEVQLILPSNLREDLELAVDRALLQRAGGKVCCAEKGCENSVWPGSRYCIWHPTLRLANRRRSRLERAR
jgi:hypothetical protein